MAYNVSLFSQISFGQGTGGALSRIGGGGTGIQQPNVPPKAINNTCVVAAILAGGGQTGFANPMVYPNSDLAWNQQADLAGSDMVIGDTITSCDFAQNGAGNVPTAVLGCPTQNSFTGAVYVFVRSALGVWTQQQKLVIGNSNGQFGYYVTIDGDTLCAVEPLVAGTGKKAYIFTRTGTVWTLQDTITIPSASGGISKPVLLFGNLFLTNSTFNSSTGVVYWYTGSGASWTLQQTLNGPSVGAVFAVVGFDGQTLVIGAPGAGSPATGLAYVYTLVGGAWTLSQTLVGSDSVNGDNFGTGVAVYGTVIVVGAPSNATNGSIYIFASASPFTQVQKITEPSPLGADGFGSTVQVGAGLPGTSSWVIAGSPERSANAGEVYFFLGPAISAPIADAPFGQLAFYGVRRRKGFISDPQPSPYEYYEKPYDYQVSPTLPVGWSFASGAFAVTEVIDTYDFELRRIDGVQLVPGGTPTYMGLDPGNFKILLLDTNKIKISNVPLLFSNLFHVPRAAASITNANASQAIPQHYWPSPPMLYLKNSAIRFALYVNSNTPLATAITFDIRFTGVNRYPCGRYNP